MLISNVHQIEVIFIMVDHRVYIYIYREELACCIILFCSFVIILINPVSFSNSRSKVQFIQLYMYTHTLIYTRISYGSGRKRESCLFSIRWHKSQDDIWYTPPNLNSKYVLSVDLHMKIQKKEERLRSTWESQHSWIIFHPCYSSKIKQRQIMLGSVAITKWNIEHEARNFVIPSLAIALPWENRGAMTWSVKVGVSATTQ